MNLDRLHKITTSRNRFSHSCKVKSKTSCFLNICVWGVLLYLQVPIPWLVLNISHQYQFLDGFGTLDNDGGWKAWKNLFKFSLAFDWLCVWDLLPCFEISMSKCYISKWLTIYCQWSTNEGNQHKIEWYSFNLVTKRGQIFIWIWVSNPQPTIGIWLCLTFHWKSELHTLHRDLSFDAILRAFFVVRLC